MKNCLTVILLFCLTALFAAGCSNNAKAGAVDMDLTTFSKTMMTAAIDNIYATPDEYLNKTIKMSGQYYSAYYSDVDRRFHYVLYIDDESCCSYGFMFERDGVYPDDYPEEGEGIEVSGTFESGEALDLIYHYLAVNEIIVLNN